MPGGGQIETKGSGLETSFPDAPVNCYVGDTAVHQAVVVHMPETSSSDDATAMEGLTAEALLRPTLFGNTRT